MSPSRSSPPRRGPIHEQVHRVGPTQGCRTLRRASLAVLTAAVASVALAAGPADARPRAERVPGSYIVTYRDSLPEPGAKTERLERARASAPGSATAGR